MKQHPDLKKTASGTDLGKNSTRLFNMIAPVYRWFYGGQKARFREVINRASAELELTSFHTILDVGCGTGALCSVLNELGMQVTGVDPAERMLSAGRNKAENRKVNFLAADVTAGLPFPDNAFDITIASYVAHGMKKAERRLMYEEMSRLAREYVVIHDYNANRSLLTTIIEWAEGGDYFRFIREAEHEMNACVTELKACFSEVRVINVDTRAAWYICTPEQIQS
jgi:ubiquinone/menaquinone biosynthesis C-methylase UbiE